jgi:hypothetical protein
LRVLRGNGARDGHRQAHTRAGDGHRLLTEDQHRRLAAAATADSTLCAPCDCGVGDAPGRDHQADPPCPALRRARAIGAIGG